MLLLCRNTEDARLLLSRAEEEARRLHAELSYLEQHFGLHDR